MQNMQISNNMEEFPADITELTLIDCNIDVGPMEKWMNAFKTTLRRLHMDNVETFYAFDNSVRVFSISKLKDLNSFTFKNQLHTIKLNTHELEFLTIISAGLTCKFGFKLRHLYCDASQVSFSGGMEQLTKLEYVTLKNWKTSLIEKCRALPSIKELEILSTVDGKHKAKIDAMPMNVLGQLLPRYGTARRAEPDIRNAQLRLPPGDSQLPLHNGMDELRATARKRRNGRCHL